MAVFTMSDMEETRIRVQAGQAFTLKFVTSPGTGYRWELAVPLDEQILLILEKRSEAARASPLGASEFEFWTCRALKAGTGEVALKYARPWENVADPIKKHIFRVDVR